MFIVYFALWVILNGKWTTEIGVFGLVFAAVLYGFSCRFMGYSFKKDLHYLRRLRRRFATARRCWRRFSRPTSR